MNKETITHNNHYVPRFYLKNWSKDGNTIYAYRLLVSNSNVPYWQQVSIRNVAVWHDLYTRRIAQEDIDDFETWFDCEFESPAKPVFDKLLNNQKITKEENIIVSRFIAAQYIRTPAALNQLLEWGRSKGPDIFHKTLNRVSNELESGKFPRTLPPLSEDDKLIPLKVTYDKERGIAQINSIIGKGMYLHSVKHVLTNTVKHMYNHQWHVIQAAEGVSFPTSDDPVICLNYRSEYDYGFKGGWGRKNGNIIMPLSPDKLLFTQIGHKGESFFLNDSLY